MGDVPVLVKFNKLVKDPFGGFSDFYSKEQRIKLENHFERVPWEKATNDPVVKNIDKQIDNTKQTIPGMIEKFQKAVDNILIENPASDSLKPFENKLPYGSEGGNNKYLMDMRLDKMRQLDLEYVYLFKNLYPDDYAEIADSEEQRFNILSDACGSMGDWPQIDPTSVGLGSINRLANLFNKYYLNYDKKISSKEFYNDFKQTSFLNIFFDKGNNNNNRKIYPQLKEKIEDMYMFNPDLWYGTGNGTGDEFKNLGGDSYGFFFKYKQLKQLSDNSQIETIDDKSGMLNWNGQALLSENEKSACVLFQEVNFEGNKKTINREKTDLTGQFTAGDPPEALKLLYNVNKNGIKHIDGTGLVFEQDNNKIFTGFNKDTTQEAAQAGGKKKKAKRMRGGNTDNGFNTANAPYLLAKRRGMEFNPKMFVKTLEKFEESRNANNNKNFNNLPVFYHNRSQKIGGIEFKKTREIFLESSVYVNTFKLYAHFFENLKNCYNFYINKELGGLRNKVSNELGKVDREYKNLVDIETVEYLDKLTTGIEKLVKYLDKIIESFRLKLIYGTDNFNAIQYFYGMKEPVDYSDEFVKMILETIRVKDEGELGLDRYKFSKFMKLSYDKSGGLVILGGLPFGSVIVKHTFRMWSVFYLLLRWRELSNETLEKDKTRYLNTVSTMLTESEMKEINEKIKVTFPKERMVLLGNMDPNNVRNKFLMVQKILEIFYKESNTYARHIAKEHKVLERNMVKNKNKSKNKKNIKNFLREKLITGKRVYLDSERSVQKILEMFEYKAQQFYGVIWNVMKPEMDLMRSTQFLYIVSRVDNMVQRLRYLNQGLYDLPNSTKKALIEQSGFNIKNLQVNNSVNASLNKVAFDKMMRIQLKNPNYIYPEWWKRLESKFNNVARDMNTLGTHSGRVNKLFVFAIAPGKLNNIYLIDIFGAAQFSSDLSGLTTGSMTSSDIKLDISLGNNQKTTNYIYSSENKIINLTPFVKKFTDLKRQKGFIKGTLTYMKKAVSKDEKEKLDMLKIKNLIEGNFMAYDKENKNFRDIYKTRRLNALFLQGSTENQLMNILYSNQRGKLADNQANQYKAYLINDEVIKNPHHMREWCYNLLFSMPNSFTEDDSMYNTLYQQPLSKFFMKSKFGYDFVKELLDIINPVGKGKVNQTKLGPDMLRKELMRTVRMGNLVSRDTILNMGLIME